MAESINKKLHKKQIKSIVSPDWIEQLVWVFSVHYKGINGNEGGKVIKKKRVK